jgi:hypothetical protein
MSMKNFIDTIVDRTRDLPACSTVPQPTAPLRAPHVPETTNFKHVISVSHLGRFRFFKKF